MNVGFANMGRMQNPPSKPAMFLQGAEYDTPVRLGKTVVGVGHEAPLFRFSPLVLTQQRTFPKVVIAVDGSG